MAYNLELAKRIWAHLAGLPGVSEKRMFGGVGYLVNGNMACGVHGENLIVRLSAEDGKKALALPYTRPFDLSGKPMRGWLYVEPAGWATDEELSGWLQQGIAYASSLPAKSTEPN